MTFRAVREVFPAQVEEMEAHPWSFCPPGGENRVRVFERGVAALGEAAGRWPGEKILVVTHEGMIKSLVYRITESLPGGPGAFLIKPDHLHRLCWVDGAVAVEQVNAVALG
jgi:broad specificity phosphatase PhoE